jgi:energy-coupling factor transport system permease protein
VVVPVALTAMEDSLQVAEAMEARAFGSGRRTRWQPLRWAWSDLVTVAVSAVAVGSFAALRAGGAQLDWLTYPTLGPPPADPAVLAAAALLALPGLIRWRSSS